MPLYETVFIARNDVTQQQVEAIADAIGVQLDADKGIAPPPPPAEGEVAESPRPSVSIKKREYWGLRSLAYRINKNRKGHYMLLGIDAAPASVAEMERQLRLNEDVLRYMTIRVDALEEGPSAILSRRSDDRERSFRGPKPAGRFESGRKRGFDEREEFRAREDALPRERDDFPGLEVE
jgi:small subunit ribosomal protein S6